MNNENATMPDQPPVTPAAERVETVLARVERLVDEALPKFNWGASVLDANAIGLLNDVPGEVRKLRADLRAGSIHVCERPAGDRVEAVARIIDPARWRVLDGYLADTLRKYKGQNAGYDPEVFKDQASMALAQQIIALLALGPAEQKVLEAARAWSMARRALDHANETGVADDYTALLVADDEAEEAFFRAAQALPALPHGGGE